MCLRANPMVPPGRHPVKRGNRNDFWGSFLVITNAVPVAPAGGGGGTAHGAASPDPEVRELIPPALENPGWAAIGFERVRSGGTHVLGDTRNPEPAWFT